VDEFGILDPTYEELQVPQSPDRGILLSHSVGSESDVIISRLRSAEPSINNHDKEHY
jgi:hypothetical protein